MSLSKETQERIERDGIKYAMSPVGIPDHNKVNGYIAGATVEALRAQQLEKVLGIAEGALKEIYTGTQFPLSEAQNALMKINKYRNNLK